MSKLKIYIMGAVTGLDPEEVRIKFNNAAMRLKEMGFVPISPIDYVPEGMDWNQAMRICISKLIECDGVFKLPDHQQSKGAMLELVIARNLELKEFTETIKRSKV
jgi:hypothetical protein